MRVRDSAKLKIIDSDQELILSIVSLEELHALMRAYDRGARGKAFIGLRQLQREIVTALLEGSTVDKQDLLKRLGCDGWLLICPSPRMYGLKVEGAVHDRRLRCEFGRGMLARKVASGTKS